MPWLQNGMALVSQSRVSDTIDESVDLEWRVHVEAESIARYSYRRS